MSRRHDTRYPHVFSKGRGVGFVGDGSVRGSAAARMRAGNGFFPNEPRAPPCRVQTASLGWTAVSAPANAATARSLKYRKVSPTVESLYRAHLGLAVVCADCLHGVGHRNPALPDLFKRQWRLTLLEIETKCRCELCGSRNARVTAWSGGEGDGMDLATPPKGGR